MTSSNEPMLFAEDIARLRKITRRQARRWLEMLEAEHGAAVVGRAPARHGVRRFTSESALARIGPRAGVVEARLVAMIRELEKRIRTLEEEVDRTNSKRTQKTSKGTPAPHG